MTPRVVFIFADAVCSNFHRTAIVRALRDRAAHWQRIDLGQWFSGATTRAAILDAGRQADAVVVHGSVFAWAYERVFADATLYIAGAAPPADYKDFLAELLALPVRRAWLADNIDLHGDFEALGIRTADFQAIGSFYYPDRFTARREVAAGLAEPWMPRHRAPEDGYARLTSIPVQIEVPFCLAEHEFVPRPRAKYWRLTIPGVGYARRRVARSRHDALSRVTQPHILPRIARRAAALSYQVSGWRRPNLWSIDFGRHLHHAVIAHSRAAYTEGSGYDYPVRKFFEIPAQRTLMLCTPHPGLADHGYRDGVTHLETSPDAVVPTAAKLDFSSSAVQEMIQAGYETTRTLHHADVRADQLIRALDLFAADRLRSARFRDGVYVYDER